MRFQIYLIILFIFNIANFCFYNRNQRYEEDDPRLMLSESLLLIMSVTFGAFGGLLYMLINRYKLQDKKYLILNIIGILIQLGILSIFIVQTFF